MRKERYESDRVLVFSLEEDTCLIDIIAQASGLSFVAINGLLSDSKIRVDGVTVKKDRIFKKRSKPCRCMGGSAIISLGEFKLKVWGLENH
jgi:hypothetical protein